MERMAWWGTLLGMLAAVAGLLVLLVHAWRETVALPGLSLVDGYWIGHLPWTAVGADLTVIGATAAVVLGTGRVWLTGGLDRRVLSSLAAAGAAFWWFLAMVGPLTGGGGYCPTCPPAGPKPLAYAYSAPGITALWLLLPAVFVGVAALTTPGATTTPKSG